MEFAKDYFKLAERHMPVYMFGNSLISHILEMKKVTGFGFKKMIFTFSNDSGFLIHSKIEMLESNRYFSNLVVNNKDKLKKWYLRAKDEIHLADKLLKEAQEGKFQKYNKYYLNLLNIFTYTSIIPFYVLAALEIMIKNLTTKEEIQEILSWFEEIRATTRYPQLTAIVTKKFFEKSGELLGINDRLASNLSPDELKDVLSGKGFDISVLKNRENFCIGYLDLKRKKVFFSYDREKIKLEEENNKNISELMGTVANKGMAKGRVRIINKISDVQKMNLGDILVSINTSPSLMPAIKKASAIITDDGGIMCHASIISRELNKPCIIGTKMATTALKDGDLVEVNANKGIVRILRRKEYVVSDNYFLTI